MEISSKRFVFVKKILLAAVLIILWLQGCDKHDSGCTWKTMYDDIHWNRVFLNKTYQVLSVHWSPYNSDFPAASLPFDTISGNDLFHIFNRQPYRIEKKLSVVEQEKLGAPPPPELAPERAISFGCGDELYFVHIYPADENRYRVILDDQHILLHFLYDDAKKIKESISELLSAR